MMSFDLLILITRAALPWLRLAKRNLRNESLSSLGISTVWDCRRSNLVDRETAYVELTIVTVDQ